MDEILVILNPMARSERAKQAWNEIKHLRGSKVHATAAAGDARALARDAVKQGYRIVVAAGGDGTINEVVNGLAGSDVALGILPVGTMNVFATELGIPADLQKAWHLIGEGHTRRIDLARANGKYFVQLAGVGLDAQVVQATSANLKKNFGPLSYLISAAQVAAQRPPRLMVESAERAVAGSFVLIGNGRFYGGPITLFKEARIDDGRLDVLIFKNLGYLDIARYLGGIIMGTHTALGDVDYFQTRKVLVRSEQDVPIEVDGEIAGKLPATFRISSRKLHVVVPRPPPARKK
jgi:YegS/Rv2252/BmrU family lipid kinase